MSGILEEMHGFLKTIVEQNKEMIDLLRQKTPPKATVIDVTAGKAEKAPKEKQIVVIDKTEEKEECKEEPKQKQPERAVLTKHCKGYRDTFGKDALVALWDKYGAEKLKDVPKDKYQDMIDDIVDALQKEVVKYGKLIPSKDAKAIVKKFGIKRMTDAGEDLAEVVARIKEALPKKAEDEDDLV